MDLLKDISIDTIRRMPDNSPIEDIMYELNFISKVLEGMKDADEGKVFTTDEVLRKVDSWVKSYGPKEHSNI
jgi:predicted transcriptional regulator